MSEHTVKRAKSNLSNSYHSFDYIEFGYEASFTKEADENKVLNVSKSDDLTDLCYENNKFCMKPKIDKNDDSSRTCFCFKTNRKNNKNDNKCKNLKDSERNFKSEKLQTYQKEKTNEITEKNECSLI